jgi:Spx/MgsR family transcriptional regulator
LTIIYGIPNCDSVRKARHWLEAHQIDYRFHDFRSDGLSHALLGQWLTSLPMSALLNKRSSSWKQLSGSEQQTLQQADIDDSGSASQTAAIALLEAHPTLIKRPVLDTGQQLMVGFSENTYTGAYNL